MPFPVELDMVETSFKNWDVQFILFNIVIYSRPGNDRKYSKNITTANHCTAFEHSNTKTWVIVILIPFLTMYRAQLSMAE